MNPCPEWIYRFIWCTMIWVILDEWSWSRPLQRNASLKLRPRQRINVCPISKQCTSMKRFSCYRMKFIHSWLPAWCFPFFFISRHITAKHASTYITQFSRSKWKKKFGYTVKAKATRKSPRRMRMIPFYVSRQIWDPKILIFIIHINFSLMRVPLFDRTKQKKRMYSECAWNSPKWEMLPLRCEIKFTFDLRL